MGFQFDYEEDDSEDFDRDDFEGYPGMEYGLN